LLWIKGDPGKGKTMLLCGIIDELIDSVPDATAVAFFFCQAADVRINQATAVLRGLIFMLIDHRPTLISHLRREYDKTGKRLFEDVNAWRVLSKILVGILQDLDDPSLPPSYIIIDALDECITDRDLLLKFVADISSKSPRVKWIVSSRNSPAIEECLNTADKHSGLWLELNEKAVAEAVTIFIRHRVKKLTEQKNYKDEIRDAVSQHLLSNAHGTFLWVALVCQELANADVSKWDAENIMKKFPPGLKKLYERMMIDIKSSKNAKLYSHILAITSITYRPLSLEELLSFVDPSSELSGNIEYLEESVQRCGSLLTLRERTVFFVHQSAKDYLLEEMVDKTFPSGIEAEHHRLFQSSLQNLKTLRRDIYGLKSPGFPIEKVIQPSPDPLAATRYSCLYWVDHLQEGCANDNANDDLVEGGLIEDFLKRNLLQWLEATSLLRAISQGLEAILKLNNLIQVGINL
jgi:hypothetical protein